MWRDNGRVQYLWNVIPLTMKHIQFVSFLTWLISCSKISGMHRRRIHIYRLKKIHVLLIRVLFYSVLFFVINPHPHTIPLMGFPSWILTEANTCPIDAWMVWFVSLKVYNKNKKLHMWLLLIINWLGSYVWFHILCERLHSKSNTDQ